MRRHTLILKPRWLRKLGHYLSIGIGMMWLVSTIAVATPPQPAPIPSVAAGSSAQRSENQSTWVQKGKAAYHQGQWLEAITAWEQALALFTASQDALNQATVLGNLALAYQQLGRSQQANQAITRSLELLGQHQHNASHRLQRAEALNIQGQVRWLQGQAESAQQAWQQAETAFRQERDEAGEIRALINQTRALRALGLYHNARSKLEQVQQVLQQQPDSLLKAAGLLNYGDTLRLLGNLQRSQEVLTQSLTMAQRLQSPPDVAAAYLSLGNLLRAQPEKTIATIQQARDYYQSAISTATSPLMQAQAHLSQLRLSIESAQANQPWSPGVMRRHLEVIDTLLPQLPVSRSAIDVRINYAELLIKLRSQGQALRPALTIAQHLSTAIQQAHDHQDSRTESYALGYLGHLYEQQQQWAQAQSLTEQALKLAEITHTPDISYQWYWQLGRLLRQQQQQEAAITAYLQAVKTLKQIRNDLVSNNLDVQFSFRESVEPIYRELVGLLLPTREPKAAGNRTAEVNQTRLKQAREVIESLQLAELDNYFREACLEARAVQIDQIDSQAAVLYPIILSDRLDVVLSLPDGTLRHHSQPISRAALQKSIGEMRATFALSSVPRQRLPILQRFYDLLIRPFESDLANSNTQTLTFVLDGALRNLPMSALHDGQQFLIEKYRLALTPGMQLLPTRPLVRQDLRVLVGGVSEANQDFSPLPGVVREIENIRAVLPAEVLFNQQFTRAAFQQKIEKTPYPVVHLATHAQFSSNRDQTFVLAWNDRIDVNTLSQLLQTREHTVRAPVELLVMSACQTAEGDDRAILGLAGVAVRSGARSTIATLWPVNDASAERFMTLFYRELAKTQQSKAEALRQAQLALMKEYKHPNHWAAFILVGNWL